MGGAGRSLWLGSQSLGTGKAQGQLPLLPACWWCRHSTPLGFLPGRPPSPAPPESILSRGRQVRDAKWPRPLIFYPASGLQGDANGPLKMHVQQGDAGSHLPRDFKGERSGVS